MADIYLETLTCFMLGTPNFDVYSYLIHSSIHSVYLDNLATLASSCFSFLDCFPLSFIRTITSVELQLNYMHNSLAEILSNGVGSLTLESPLLLCLLVIVNGEDNL